MSPLGRLYIISVGILFYAAFCLMKCALNLLVVCLVVMMFASYGLLFRLLFLLASGSAVPDWTNLSTCFTSSAAGHESRCASTVDSMLYYVCLGGYQLLQVVLELLRRSVIFNRLAYFVQMRDWRSLRYELIACALVVLDLINGAATNWIQR